MNKTEFINAVAEKAGLSKVDGKKAVKAMIKTIQSEMKKGEKVSIFVIGGVWQGRIERKIFIFLVCGPQFGLPSATLA